MIRNWRKIVTAYLMKPSEDNTLEVDIVNGEFGGKVGVKYFNLDFSRIDYDGETKYDYQLYLKEEIDFDVETKIRLECVLDDILSDIVNEALKYSREIHAKT